MAKRKKKPKFKPTPEQEKALQDYIAWAGEGWQNKLQGDFMRAGSAWPGEWAYLQQVRNSPGGMEWAYYYEHERAGNPPKRLSEDNETVTGVTLAGDSEESFYDSTDKALRNAVSSSLNMLGEPSTFRQYTGDGEGGWVSSPLYEVRTEELDHTRREYPVRVANPEPAPRKLKSKLLR